MLPRTPKADKMGGFEIRNKKKKNQGEKSRVSNSAIDLYEFVY